jgi:CRISPR-associated protein Csb1
MRHAAFTAYNVVPKTRSAQANATYDMSGADMQREFGEIEAGEKIEKHPLAQLGFLPVPAVGAHGGIVVGGPILRLTHISLENIRRLSIPSDDNKTLALRRYILGLSLFEVLAYSNFHLRSGCDLVRKEDPVASLLPGRMPLNFDLDAVYAYVRRTATEFGVTTEKKTFTLSQERIRQAALEKKAENGKGKGRGKKGS